VAVTRPPSLKTVLLAMDGPSNNGLIDLRGIPKKEMADVVAWLDSAFVYDPTTGLALAPASQQMPDAQSKALVSRLMQGFNEAERSHWVKVVGTARPGRRGPITVADTSGPGPITVVGTPGPGLRRSMTYCPVHDDAYPDTGLAPTAALQAELVATRIHAALLDSVAIDRKALDGAELAEKEANEALAEASHSGNPAEILAKSIALAVAGAATEKASQAYKEAVVDHAVVAAKKVSDEAAEAADHAERAVEDAYRWADGLRQDAVAARAAAMAAKQAFAAALLAFDAAGDDPQKRAIAERNLSIAGQAKTAADAKAKQADDAAKQAYADARAADAFLAAANEASAAADKAYQQAVAAKKELDEAKARQAEKDAASAAVARAKAEAGDGVLWDHWAHWWCEEIYISHWLCVILNAADEIVSAICSLLGIGGWIIDLILGILSAVVSADEGRGVDIWFTWVGVFWPTPAD
jgi:hypothetical protein